MKILIYGYGNPGRRDDGLGVLFSEKIEKWIVENKFKNIFCDSNYQLNIEDADNITEYDIVIFADATIEDSVKSFKLTHLIPDGKVTFSMHSVTPEFVLNLSGTITDNPPKSYLLHLKGFEWNFLEELTEDGNENLKKALDFIKPILSSVQENNFSHTINLLNNCCEE